VVALGAIERHGGNVFIFINRLELVSVMGFPWLFEWTSGVVGCSN